MRCILLLCLLLASAACFPDEPPTISELTISPSTIPVGRATIVRGKFLYDDPDGHELWVHIEISLPNQNPERVPFLQSSVSPSHNGFGAADWWIEMRPSKAGTYRVVATFEDGDRDLVSNRLEGAFTAE